jgi:hypothetical protein
MKSNSLFSNPQSSCNAQENIQSPARRFLFGPLNSQSLPNFGDLSFLESSSDRFVRAWSTDDLPEAEKFYRQNNPEPLAQNITNLGVFSPVNTPGRFAPLRRGSSYFDLSPLSSPDRDPLLPPISDNFELPSQLNVEPRLYSSSPSIDSPRGEIGIEQFQQNLPLREYSVVSEPSIHSHDSTPESSSIRLPFSEPPALSYQPANDSNSPIAESRIDPININSPRQINRVRRDQTPFVAGLEFLASNQEGSPLFNETTMPAINSSFNSDKPVSTSPQPQSSDASPSNPRAFSIDASPSSNARIFFTSPPQPSPLRDPSSIVGSPTALNLDRNIARGNLSSEK